MQSLRDDMRAGTDGTVAQMAVVASMKPSGVVIRVESFSRRKVSKNLAKKVQLLLRKQKKQIRGGSGEGGSAPLPSLQSCGAPVRDATGGSGGHSLP